MLTAVPRSRFWFLLSALTGLSLLTQACSTVSGDDVDQPELESTSSELNESSTGPIRYTFNIVGTYPHDTSMFTQGLEFVDDLLIESGGDYGRSSLRIYNPVDGAVVESVRVADELFAEGATVVGDQVWQLTWQAEKALVYELDGLRLIDEVSYQGEGWGLCLLDDQLVMSDGSDQLIFRSPTDFAVSGSVTVTLEGSGSIAAINELECVSDNGGDGGPSGTVWANVWKSNTIYGIDAATGQITHVVDASELVPPGYEDDTDRVLNGIAVHPDTGRFWLTGKRWPVLYEVELVPS